MYRIVGSSFAACSFKAHDTSAYMQYATLDTIYRSKQTKEERRKLKPNKVLFEKLSVPLLSFVTFIHQTDPS